MVPLVRGDRAGLVYAMNIADRYVVSTLMEPIRLDLNLTDSGIAMLTATALALFYVTIRIPVSALADRANRRDLPPKDPSF
jgi:predicted MFS family arabinose efflux permease